MWGKKKAGGVAESGVEQAKVQAPIQECVDAHHTLDKHHTLGSKHHPLAIDTQGPHKGHDQTHQHC